MPRRSIFDVVSEILNASEMLDPDWQPKATWGSGDAYYLTGHSPPRSENPLPLVIDLGDHRDYHATGYHAQMIVIPASVLRTLLNAATSLKIWNERHQTSYGILREKLRQSQLEREQLNAAEMDEYETKLGEREHTIMDLRNALAQANSAHQKALRNWQKAISGITEGLQFVPLEVYQSLEANYEKVRKDAIALGGENVRMPNQVREAAGKWRGKMREHEQLVERHAALQERFAKMETERDDAESKLRYLDEMTDVDVDDHLRLWTADWDSERDYDEYD